MELSEVNEPILLESRSWIDWDERSISSLSYQGYLSWIWSVLLYFDLLIILKMYLDMNILLTFLDPRDAGFNWDGDLIICLSVNISCKTLSGEGLFQVPR